VSIRRLESGKKLIAPFILKIAVTAKLTNPLDMRVSSQQALNRKSAIANVRSTHHIDDDHFSKSGVKLTSGGILKHIWHHIAAMPAMSHQSSH
jgi:hypothetical protein